MTIWKRWTRFMNMVEDYEILSGENLVMLRFPQTLTIII